MKQQFLNDSGLTELIGYIKKYVKDEQDVKPYASLSVFPKTGEQNIIYIDTTVNTSYYWDDTSKTYKALDVQTWATLNGKPSTFPPEDHNHDDRYFTETEMNSKLAGKANSSHKHKKADITDFPTSMPASDVPVWAKASTKPTYTKAEVGLGNVDNTADKDKSVKYATSAGSAGTASSVDWSGVKNPPTTYAPSAHTHGSGDITSLSADKITGVIGIDHLPAGALERCKIVADDTARFKLTKNDIQNGDTVKVGTDANAKMYLVIDDTKLSSEAGYTIYTAGSATSVPWSGVTGKPSTFTPTSHKHTISDITNISSASVSYAISAGSATKLGTSAGSATQPIYFSDGKPVATTYTLNASVPAGAKFTDTNTWRGIQNNLTSDSTIDSLAAAQGKVLKALVDSKAAASHTHTIAQVSGLQSALDGKAASVHTHSYAGSASAGGSANSSVLLAPAYTASTFTTTSSTWRNGVTDGYVVWGQCWKDTRLSSDTGDISLWIKKSDSLTTLNMTLDGDVYAAGFHGNLYGCASTAIALTTSAGSATQPVYFSGGKPMACSYTINASVPSGAKFTDTNTWRGIQNNLASDSTSDSLSAAQGKVLKGLVDGKAASNHTHPCVANNCANGGTNGYLLIATLKITAAYNNSPIEITISRRGDLIPTRINIIFDNLNSTDPTLNSLRVWGYTSQVWIHKSAKSTWNLYTQKTETYDNVGVLSYFKSSNDNGISITWGNTAVTTLPSGAVQASTASFIVSASYAVSAGNSTKWNGYELDLSTNNTTDTWLLVANNGKIQHRLSTSFASVSHTHSYLPLSGGTLTGFVSQTGSGTKDVGYEARNTDTGASVKFMVGSGKWNKGLYDTNAGNWMVYADQNNKVYLNGTAATASAVSWKNVTDKRRCYVGQSGSTKTKPWYKFASFKTTVAYEDRRISFKVSGGFGSNDSRCGVLTAHLRTNEHKNEESVWLRWEYATNLIDPSKFVLIYKNTTNTSTDVELWVKIDEPYVFYHFTVLTEEYRDIFADYSWTLYNQHSAGYADAPTSGYTQVYSKVCHLADKMSMSSLYGYYGMITPSGSDREYIRTTSNGLLPYQSGGAGNGHSTLGTPSWYFSSAYIDNVNAAASVKIGQPNNSNNGAIELYGNTPYIDFHTSGTNTDYSSRIIAYSDRIEFVFA